MHPVLFAFYDDGTTMADLVTASWLDSLAPTGESSPSDPIEVRIVDPSPPEQFEISSFETPPTPVVESDIVRVGEGYWAMYDDLRVESLLSTESADAYDGPIVRVSLRENRLTDAEDIERTRTRTEQVLRLAIELFETSSPEFLFVTPYGPMQGDTIPRPGEYVSTVTGTLSWLYGLSADLATNLGRERLLSAPVYETRALENGGLLLRMYETMVNDDIDPESRDRLREHLDRG